MTRVRPVSVLSTYQFRGTGRGKLQPFGGLVRLIPYMTKPPADLLYGTIDLLVLKSLSWNAMHGYAISRWLRERSGGTLELDDAALYKSLHRLEEEGTITSVWGLSENNRKARYYRLAPAGRKRLKVERTAWQSFTLGVSRILRAAEP